MPSSLPENAQIHIHKAAESNGTLAKGGKGYSDIPTRALM